MSSLTATKITESPKQSYKSTANGDACAERVDWSRATILEFIADYRSHRVLWDTNARGFHTKALKHEALRQLSQKYRTSVRSVRCKIKSLRSSFHREHGKVVSGRLHGIMYRPLWFAYDAFRFILDDNDVCRRTAFNTTSSSAQADEAFKSPLTAVDDNSGAATATPCWPVYNNNNSSNNNGSLDAYFRIRQLLLPATTTTTTASAGVEFAAVNAQFATNFARAVATIRQLSASTAAASGHEDSAASEGLTGTERSEEDNRMQQSNADNADAVFKPNTWNNNRPDSTTLNMSQGWNFHPPMALNFEKREAVKPELGYGIAKRPCLEVPHRSEQEQSGHASDEVPSEEEQRKPLQLTSSARALDECDIFGDYVSMTLRKLRTPMARTNVKHLINNILYNAELGAYDVNIRASAASSEKQFS